MSIKIGPMEKDCINTLLSETLCLPPRLCHPLSTLVHNKTGGIALWVLDFLKSLNEEGLLWFNFSSRRWWVPRSCFACTYILAHDVIRFIFRFCVIREYDSHGIELKEISEDVSVCCLLFFFWFAILINMDCQVVEHMSERMTRKWKWVSGLAQFWLPILMRVLNMFPIRPTTWGAIRSQASSLFGVEI